ncbi:putative F-box protein At1g67623 [Lotus japonicus]|uniref:putative F-box protein At1g67623 n=1 Tax=Lotus japonicus TaxID=34305 RepID=UPI002589A94D|nr:putative F-box protein At1g67623 [Lotus japonicus]
MVHPRLVKRARSKRRRTHKLSYSTSSTKQLPSTNPAAAINLLPRDLLVEVIAKVASDSFIDLHTIKTCWKDFLDATNDSYVWQRVSLDKFPLIHWSNDKASWFLSRCRDSGNIESLFREGLREYFNCPHGKMNSLEILKMAAQKGHKEAKYVYGMILLCSKNDELRKQGLENMRFLRKSKCVVSCRNKVKRLLDSMWKKNSPLERNHIPQCQFKSTCKGWRVKTGGWVLLNDEDDDISLCEYCRWDHELKSFYPLFNVH